LRSYRREVRWHHHPLGKFGTSDDNRSTGKTADRHNYLRFHTLLCHLLKGSAGGWFMRESDIDVGVGFGQFGDLSGIVGRLPTPLHNLDNLIMAIFLER